MKRPELEIVEIHRIEHQHGNGVSWECQCHDEAISAQNCEANHCGVDP